MRSKARDSSSQLIDSPPETSSCKIVSRQQGATIHVAWSDESRKQCTHAVRPTTTCFDISTKMNRSDMDLSMFEGISWPGKPGSRGGQTGPILILEEISSPAGRGWSPHFLGHRLVRDRPHKKTVRPGWGVLGDSLDLLTAVRRSGQSPPGSRLHGCILLSTWLPLIGPPGCFQSLANRSFSAPQH
jgi:hypothetical protein